MSVRVYRIRSKRDRQWAALSGLGQWYFTERIEHAEARASYCGAEVLVDALERNGFGELEIVEGTR